MKERRERVEVMVTLVSYVSDTHLLFVSCYSLVLFVGSLGFLFCQLVCFLFWCFCFFWLGGFCFFVFVFFGICVFDCFLF